MFIIRLCIIKIKLLWIQYMYLYMYIYFHIPQISHIEELMALHIHG